MEVGGRRGLLPRGVAHDPHTPRRRARPNRSRDTGSGRPKCGLKPGTERPWFGADLTENRSVGVACTSNDRVAEEAQGLLTEITRRSQEKGPHNVPNEMVGWRNVCLSNS